jgi:hypothetical protein
MQRELLRILAIGDSPDVSLLRVEYPDADIVTMHAPRHVDPVELIDNIRAGRFDAAFVSTETPRAPWELAYCCYLAGVPHRFGTSKEFGGALLSDFAGRPA